ncbi:MAG: hypothetical protein QOJ65_1004 [Fimbriimonadaceae bacterium]|nr:hypothetical protein [Fimbriimonadaceae bacterium]
MMVLLAILLGLGGAALTSVAGDSPLPAFGAALLLAAIVLWFWGLAHYCMSKGYGGSLAAIGILGIIGLIILAVLPDKLKADAPPVMSETNYPRPDISAGPTVD